MTDIRMMKCRTQKVVTLTLSPLTAFLLVFFLVCNISAVELNIKPNADATQLEFKGKAFWDYWLDKKGNSLEMKIDKIPEKEYAKLLNYSDKYIKKIEIISELDKQLHLKIHLTSESVESFAYQMEAPSRLLIDFYVDQVKEVKKKKVAKKAKSSSKKQAKRIPASDTPIEVSPSQKEEVKENKEPKILGLFDGADTNYERLSLKEYEIHRDALIASQQKVFVDFPFILTKNNFIQDLEENLPIYKIEEGKTKENKQARLLLTIFNNKRYALFLTSLKVFRESFSNSKYTHMLRYMEADSHYHLWKELNEHASFVKAMALYKKLLEDYPKSPLYNRTRMLIAYGQLQKNNYVVALQEFLSIKTNEKNFPFKDEIEISIGDSYLALNKFEDSIKAYRNVASISENDSVRKKAEYKVADVYAKRKEYEKTIQTYNDVIKKYPETAKEMENAYFNLGETYFRIKDYRKAHDYFLTYLKSFPLKKSGAYALHRIGEILDIMTLNKEKIRGAFLENTFRFPKTPGAFLSEMRIKLSRAPEMKEKELADTVNEIDQFLKNNYDLKLLDHYITSYLEEAYFNRGDYDKSWDLLQTYYKNHITSPTIPFYREKIARNITARIGKKLNEEEYIEALRIYGKNKDLWLKDQDRFDLKYNLAKTFEKTTAYKMSANLYREVLNKLYSIEGTEEQRKRELFEHIPSKEAVQLRLAKVYFEEKDYEKSLEYIRLSKDDRELSKDEVYEKNALIADISIQRGNYKAAREHLNYLVKSWKSLPQKVVSPYLKLADISLRQGNAKDAHEIYDQMIHFYKDSKSIDESIYAKVLEKKSQIYIEDKNTDLAIKTLEDLMQVNTDYPFYNARYKLGKLYYEKGNLAKAEEYWKPLSQTEEGKMWYQLGQEKLQEAKWNDSYDKYIERLPAGKIRSE